MVVDFKVQTHACVLYSILQHKFEKFEIVATYRHFASYLFGVGLGPCLDVHGSTLIHTCSGLRCRLR